MGRPSTPSFLGLLDADEDSYLRAEPGWTPTLPVRDADRRFTMADLLTVAGVDPTGRAAGSTGLLEVSSPVDVADGPGEEGTGPDRGDRDRRPPRSRR